MATKENVTNSVRNKRKLCRVRAKEQTVLSVVSLRISDGEKNRIDEIMLRGNIKHYSDVMKIAIKLVKVPSNDDIECAWTYN